MWKANIYDKKALKNDLKVYCAHEYVYLHTRDVYNSEIDLQ